MVKMKEMNSDDTKNNFTRIIKGSIISVALTLILLFIYSIFLTYTKLNENTIPLFVIGITAISIFIGSLISSIHIKKNGIINGAMVGLIYIIAIYLISSTISKDFSLNMYSTIMIISSVIAGAVGGIIGVNKKN